MSQNGANIIIEITNTVATPALVTILGLRTRSLSFNAETVDVTHATSTGLWRELLPGAGVISASIAGDGVFKDSTGEEEIRAAFFDRSNRNMRATFPGFGTFTGLFRVATFEVSGEYNDALMFSATFESAGPITFASIT